MHASGVRICVCIAILCSQNDNKAICLLTKYVLAFMLTYLRAIPPTHILLLHFPSFYAAQPWCVVVLPRSSMYVCFDVHNNHMHTIINCNFDSEILTIMVWYNNNSQTTISAESMAVVH